MAARRRPGTAADLKWWLGTTGAAVRRALTDLHAVEVDRGGQTGCLLPDDLEVTDPVEPWAALLPPLAPGPPELADRSDRLAIESVGRFLLR